MKLAINTDGACRGNPWHSSVGVHVRNAENNNVIKKHYRYIGIRTNNEAEYQGIIDALCIIRSYAEQEGKKIEATITVDSKMCFMQCTKQWKVKHENLQQLYDEVCHHTKNINKLYGSTVEYHRVRRESNQEADKLANIALDLYMAYWLANDSKKVKMLMGNI